MPTSIIHRFIFTDTDSTVKRNFTEHSVNINLLSSVPHTFLMGLTKRLEEKIHFQAWRYKILPFYIHGSVHHYYINNIQQDARVCRYLFTAKSPRSDPSIRATSALLSAGVRDSVYCDFHLESFVSSALIN